MTNTYSTTWLELFLEPIQPVQTEREIMLVEHWLPRPAYTTVLDLCCGQGRHARLLAKCGYRVTGVDLNAEALDVARRQSDDQIVYIRRDMRELDSLPGTFDALICMWQSFGYFDTATNQEVLSQIGRKLRAGGRLILDIYHRGFFERNQGVRSFEREGVTVTETKRMDGDRLTVRLDYGGSAVADVFEWQLFAPEEIRELAERCGFATLAICAGFDEALPASVESPRMQLVFERRLFNG